MIDSFHKKYLFENDVVLKFAAKEWAFCEKHDIYSSFQLAILVVKDGKQKNGTEKQCFVLSRIGGKCFTLRRKKKH